MLFYNFHTDRRTELLNFARDEGIILPLPVEAIVSLEHKGCIVDLCTGKVTLASPTLTRYAPTRLGRAVSHLLTPAQAEAELEDLREWRDDENYHRSGAW